jgi:diadenosine tetraphosphatase ApaH/serine/threonine PP2A family protein phosphatase
MWIGLLSDIHANREALEACLNHARGNGITHFIFLGDYVGYGADPGFAVDTVLREVENGATALLGNHDDAIASGTDGMNAVAAAAIDWTRSQLTAAQCDFLARLPLTLDDNDRLFVHASAHDPAGWDYITSAEDASACYAATRAQAPPLTGQPATLRDNSGADDRDSTARERKMDRGDRFGWPAPRRESGGLLWRARDRAQCSGLCARSL